MDDLISFIGPCIIDAGDMAIIRGNNHPPMIWQFLVSINPDVLFDLTGSIFKLTVRWPGGTAIVRTSGTDPDLVIDLVTSKLTWNYAVVDTRLMPLGRVGSYELERWIDSTQQTLVKGGLSVDPGDNPD
jgi:hypothetical protein